MANSMTYAPASPDPWVLRRNATWTYLILDDLRRTKTKMNNQGHTPNQ